VLGRVVCVIVLAILDFVLEFPTSGGVSVRPLPAGNSDGTASGPQRRECRECVVRVRHQELHTSWSKWMSELS
jgi:hypothetical protein